MVEKEMDNNEITKEIELQLHEQYAINANSNVASTISLATVLLAVLGGYGYMYIHSYLFVSCCHGMEKVYSQNQVYVGAMAAIGIIVILFYVALDTGFAQRRDQFVTFAIRCKYYGNQYNSPKVFPSGYHPFNKKVCDFIPGTHGVYLRILFIISLALLASVRYMQFRSNVCSCNNTFSTSFYSTCFIGYIIVIACFLHRMKKYRKLCIEYRQLKKYVSERDDECVCCKLVVDLMKLIFSIGTPIFIVFLLLN